jgi:hypothetical protein
MKPIVYDQDLSRRDNNHHVSSLSDEHHLLGRNISAGSQIVRLVAGKCKSTPAQVAVLQPLRMRGLSPGARRSHLTLLTE